MKNFFDFSIQVCKLWKHELVFILAAVYFNGLKIGDIKTLFKLASIRHHLLCLEKLHSSLVMWYIIN